jgi:hypothetical protein
MSGNSHPWRIMTAVFGAVLLCSFGLEKLLSPAGDAAVRAVDGRTVSLTGTIAIRPFDSSIVLQSGGTVYVLSNPEAARSFVGRQVRIAGTVHRSNSRLAIETIVEAGGHP